MNYTQEEMELIEQFKELANKTSKEMLVLL